MGYYVARPAGGSRFGKLFAYGDIVDPQLVGTRELDPERCPQCGEGLGSLRWLPPHRIALSSKRYPDALWGAGFYVMFSHRLKRLYESHKFRGVLWFDPPAEIVRVGRRRTANVQPWPPDYHNVVFTLGGASLDDARSGANRPTGLCSYCRGGINSLEKVAFLPGSWTGADVFSAYGLVGVIIVSQRLADVISEEQVTNIELTPIEDYRFSF